MISAKEIRKLAMKYLTSQGWDRKRDIIREVFRQSPKSDRQINIQFFADCLGMSFFYIYQQGGIDIYIQELKRLKYGQKQNMKKSKNKALNIKIKKKQEKINELEKKIIENKKTIKVWKIEKDKKMVKFECCNEYDRNLLSQHKALKLKKYKDIDVKDIFDDANNTGSNGKRTNGGCIISTQKGKVYS